MIAFLAIVYCVGLYLIFVRFRLIPFNLPAQILAGSVGFFGLLIVLFGMNYTQPFSIGLTVSALTTPVEARVPGRVIEVPVKDNQSVKKGDVLFRIDPQPYVDGLHQVEAALAQAQIQTQTAILQATEGVNAATANLNAITATASAAAANVAASTAVVEATRSAISAMESHLSLAQTRQKQYKELADKKRRQPVQRGTLGYGGRQPERPGRGQAAGAGGPAATAHCRPATAGRR